MPYGVIVNSLSVFFGGCLGYLIKDKIPDRLRAALPPLFGLVSIMLGIAAMVQVRRLPAVALALITGCIAGETLRLEERLTRLVGRALHRGGKGAAPNIDSLISIVVLFCASGTGVYGALESRMSGDHTILFTKSILDFFTSGLFAAILGGVVCLIALPQFAVLLGLFFSAGAILPYATPEMVLDFRACGGVIMLATGLRIAHIKHYSIVNLLPAFLLAMPFSYWWGALL